MADNGKFENVDLEHELPAAEGGETNTETAAGGVEQAAQTELEQVKRERDALLDRVARLQAEFDNARKRAAREQQEFREFAVADAVRNLLPVLDSFDRALNTTSSSDDLRSGMELIHRQLTDALGKLGVEVVEAQGAAFDPTQHEALGVVESDTVESNHVAEELQRGYKLKGRLLRPAMVRVAK